MRDSDAYFADIDSNRLRRAKELSEIGSRIGGQVTGSFYGVPAKAVIVLAYSHWEGFYNECIAIYLDHLKAAGARVTDVRWSMLVGLLRPQLQRLRDKNHSVEAELDFVEALQGTLREDFIGFDHSVVASKSNLDFHKLTHNFRVLGFDIRRFQKWRLRIDRELVGWRHSVAHGDNPDLTNLYVKNHISFTQELLLALADIFQEEIIWMDNRGAA